MIRKQITLEMDYELTIALSKLSTETQMQFMKILGEIQDEYDEMFQLSHITKNTKNVRVVL